MKGNCFEFAKSGSCKFGTGCKFHHIRSASTRPDLGSSRKFNTPRGSQNGGPIDVFFSQFPCFGYNTTAPVWDEFEFLCQFNEWDDDDYKKRQAKREFKDALIREFGTLYGTMPTNFGHGRSCVKPFKSHPSLMMSRFAVRYVVDSASLHLLQRFCICFVVIHILTYLHLYSMFSSYTLTLWILLTMSEREKGRRYSPGSKTSDSTPSQQERFSRRMRQRLRGP